MSKFRKTTLIDVIRRFLLSLLYRMEIVGKRTRQKLLSFRPDSNHNHFHLLCVRRSEYIEAAKKCANSIWEHMPGATVTIWVDQSSLQVLRSKKGFDRPSCLEVRRIENEDLDWQLNKMTIILEKMGPNDTFTDADIVWNGELSKQDGNLFFVNEGDMRKLTKFNYLLNQLGLDSHRKWFLLNVSVVRLQEGMRDSAFQIRCASLYSSIRKLESNELLGEIDARDLRRLAEQITLSIAVQERSDFVVLKDSDSVMDGGIAESYYLGSSRGWN